MSRRYPAQDRISGMNRLARWQPLFLVFLLTLPARSGGAAEKVSPPLSCREIQGLEPLLRQGQILLLGEMHGTREIPAFVAGATCRGLRAGRSVTVALEIPTEEEPRIAAYLASGGKDGDRAALLAGPFWRADFQDGRRSQGMLSLLEDLRCLHQEGRKLRVKLLDRLPTAAGPERDRAMAGELEAAIETSRDDLFVVLTGNVHTRTVRGTPWDPKIENMGYLVAQRHPGVVALDVAYSGGTVWICPDPNPASCGARPVHAKGDGRTPGVKLYGTPSPEGFNGEYSVGALTASPPARRSFGGAK